MTQSPSHNFGTPSDNWASGSGRQKDPTRWVPAMIVGALLFGTGCGSGLIVGWIGGTANSFGDLIGDAAFTPTEVVLDVQFPDVVTEGETFDLVVEITDTRGIDRVIEDIDFSGTFCDNMYVESVKPASLTDSITPGYHEYVFSAPLAASTTQIYTFRVTPNTDGVFTGDVTVYMEDYNSESTPVSFVVQSQD